MQAVIALCYFCENHGPRIVMVCQPMRNNYLDEKFEDSHNADNMETDEDVVRFYGDAGCHEDVVDDNKRCAACSSFGAGLGILSNDHEAATSYVSTQIAIHKPVQELVKNACLRSLLVEVSTPLCVADSESPSCSNSTAGSAIPSFKVTEDEATDGVVFFGNDEDGYVLSQTFRLKDAKARGFKRRYSLIVIARDKLMLLSNYEFFLGGFSVMITKLQAVAMKQYECEQQFDVDIRMAAKNNRGSYMPQHFYPRKVNLDTSRSLTEITNNKDIFILLHRQMLFLLRMQTMLEQDVVLEGVPTQDMLVMMEMKQETMDESDLLMMSVQHSFAHFYNLRIIVGKLYAIDPQILNYLIWHVVVGGQVIVKSNYRSIRQLFLLALVNLVPLGCAKLSSNSTVYQQRYNFLGCPLDVDIPNDVKSNAFEIEITSNSMMPSVAMEGDAGDFSQCGYKIHNLPLKGKTAPLIVGRYMELLLHPLLNVITLESSIRSTRHDWLNRAKLIFQLRHQKEGIDIDKIIKIIKCSIEDSPVLLFWQSGLSHRYKQAVLNTISDHLTGQRPVVSAFSPSKKIRCELAKNTHEQSQNINIQPSSARRKIVTDSTTNKPCEEVEMEFLLK